MNTVNTVTTSTTAQSLYVATPYTTTAPYTTATMNIFPACKLVEEFNKDCTVGLYSKPASIQIKNVKIIENKGAAVGIIVEFSDGDIQKAICSEDDTFNLETGFMVCAAKHAFYLAGYKKTATKELNNTVEKIFKQYTKQTIAAADEEANKAALAYRRAKRLEKKKRRMERRAAAEKERQIDIQAEGFLRAMRQFEKEKND